MYREAEIEIRQMREVVGRHSNAQHLDVVDALIATIVGQARASRPLKPWWEVWNTLARTRRGVMVTPPICQGCHGRGFNHRTVARDMARTGSPVCGECRGSRQGQSQFVHLQPLPDVLVTRYAAVTQP